MALKYFLIGLNKKIRNPFIFLGKAHMSLRRIWFKVTKIKVRSCLVSRVVIKQIGGFQLVYLIIMELNNHMTCYEFKCWWKIYL